MKQPISVEYGGAGQPLVHRMKGLSASPTVNVFDYHYDTKPEDSSAMQSRMWRPISTIYESDIALFKDLGFNGLRTSIQWTLD